MSKCVCGGRTCGYPDFSPGHSSSCDVAPGKPGDPSLARSNGHEGAVPYPSSRYGGSRVVMASNPPAPGSRIRHFEYGKTEAINKAIDEWKADPNNNGMTLYNAKLNTSRLPWNPCRLWIWTVQIMQTENEEFRAKCMNSLGRFGIVGCQTKAKETNDLELIGLWAQADMAQTILLRTIGDRMRIAKDDNDPILNLFSNKNYKTGEKLFDEVAWLDMMLERCNMQPPPPPEKK